MKYFDRAAFQAALLARAKKMGISEWTAEQQCGQTKQSIFRLTMNQPRIDAVVAFTDWLKQPITKFIKER